MKNREHPIYLDLPIVVGENAITHVEMSADFKKHRGKKSKILGDNHSDSVHYSSDGLGAISSELGWLMNKRNLLRKRKVTPNTWDPDGVDRVEYLGYGELENILWNLKGPMIVYDIPTNSEEKLVEIIKDFSFKRYESPKRRFPYPRESWRAYQYLYEGRR